MIRRHWTFATFFLDEYKMSPQSEVWDRAAVSYQPVSACRSPGGEMEAGGALINGPLLGHLDTIEFEGTFHDGTFHVGRFLILVHFILVHFMLL